jgi:hypothetical protein
LLLASTDDQLMDNSKSPSVNSVHHNSINYMSDDGNYAVGSIYSCRAIFILKMRGHAKCKSVMSMTKTRSSH